MAGSKILSIYTTVAAEIPDLDITTNYQDPDIGDILEIFINDTYQFFNSRDISEGYIVVVGNDNFLKDLDINIDVSGVLVVSGDEANKYDIDSNGNLTYTY